MMAKSIAAPVLAGLLVLASLARADNGGLRDFGVAYYPEAWPEERWETDLQMMRDLGVNLIRIGEFNWSGFEPTEGVFDFKPYLRLLDLCTKYGISVMMCTPTAATPKWMQADYPETEKTRADGTQPACGIRQSSCATNERFRFFSRRIVEKMAEAFKDHPAVTTWQLDNELNIYGATGECCCKSCEKAYREDLKRRYGTLENLNKEFNGAFWSGRFTKWEDVRVPIDRNRTGWKTDYVRFLGEQFLAYTLEQAAILRKANPSWRITSNNPSCSNIVRHDTLFRDLGYAAADTYCASSKPDATLIPAWTWTSFRGLTGVQRPFMIGETGPFCFDTDCDNSFDLVKPWFWLMIGHGAESVMYFRWRMSVAGEETHGAILPWDGKKTFVYDMIKKQMDEYRSLPESIARLPLDKSDVAIVHDAASHISTLSLAVSFKKPDQTMFTEAYLLSALERRGVKTDIVQLADDLDLSQYRVVFLPLCLSVSQSFQAKIRRYVADGGVVVAVNRLNFLSPMGGYYYPETCPVGMTDLFGIEISERRTISYGNVELAEPTTAETFLKHEGGCFMKKPLLTRQANGRGVAWYCTRTLDEETAGKVVKTVLGREGVAMRELLPVGVSRMTRGKYVIYVNYTPEPAEVANEEGDLLLGAPEVADRRMTIKPNDVVVYKRRADLRGASPAWTTAGKDAAPDRVAGPANGPAIPAPRTDWAGGAYCHLMNEMSRAVRGQDFDLVVFGDSITMGWIYPETDKSWPGGREVWQRHFGHLKTANFGVSGDRTEHVLWRIENAGQADGWTAKTIVLAIGENNHGQVRTGWTTNDTPSGAASGTKAILDAILARHPESRIVLIGLLPRPGKDGDGHVWMRKYNAELAKLAGGRVSFHDISARFLAESGRQAAGLFRDGVHPLPAGYEVYAQELNRILKEINRH